MSSVPPTYKIPTKDFELLVTRGKGNSLKIAHEPIDRESSVLDALHSASREMIGWQEGLASEIIESMHSLDPRFDDQQSFASSNNRGSVDFILDRYRSDLYTIGRFVDTDLGYLPASIHDNWKSSNCVANLSIHANQIRGFDPETAKKDVAGLELKDDDRLHLDDTLSEAAQIRGFLLPALDAYEERFDHYVSNVEALVPGIFAHKRYCCNFTGAYGESELDFVIAPGNQCIVERIDQYYDAVLLEQLYARYDAKEDVIAYSHRKLGWETFEIELDREAGLDMILKSNFGFGNSSYFMSLLRYKDINAINAPFLIFYSGVRKAEFAGYTYSYKISEESYRSCFENAVDLHDEYRRIGEGAFVERHFRKALSDLSDLLAIVAQTETFLEITTLERFSDLTSGRCNELIPDEGFSQISFELSERTVNEVDHIAETIWTSQTESDINYSNIKMRIESLAREDAHYDKVRKLQELVTTDLIRNRLIVYLSSKAENPEKVKELVNSIVPAEPGMYTKTYEGYELINVRIAKAESVLSFIDRIKKIIEVVRFETILASMEKSCKSISKQANQYLAEIIDPELSEIIPKRDQAQAALKELDARISKLENSKTGISWLRKQRESTRQTFNELNVSITRLTSQKGRIQGFEKALNVFA